MPNLKDTSQRNRWEERTFHSEKKERMSVQILAYLCNVAVTLLNLKIEDRHHCHQERDGRRQGADIWENRRETKSLKCRWAVKTQPPENTKPAVYSRGAPVPGWHQCHTAHFVLGIGKASHDNGLVAHPTVILGAVIITVIVKMPLNIQHPLSAPADQSMQRLCSLRASIAFVLFSFKKAANYKHWRM